MLALRVEKWSLRLIAREIAASGSAAIRPRRRCKAVASALEQSYEDGQPEWLTHLLT